jgi:Ca2+-binding RTX toxin-like protein
LVRPPRRPVLPQHPDPRPRRDTPIPLYGHDVLAGGAGDDLVFGQLGADVLHGDGRIVLLVSADLPGRDRRGDRPGRPGSAALAWVGPFALSSNTDGSVTFRGTTYRAWVVALPDADSADGDDYVEGGGGDDLIFGGLGQDDLIGGSSDLFGLTTPDAASRRQRRHLRRERRPVRLALNDLRSDRRQPARP